MYILVEVELSAPRAKEERISRFSLHQCVSYKNVIKQEGKTDLQTYEAEEGFLRDYRIFKRQFCLCFPSSLFSQSAGT